MTEYDRSSEDVGNIVELGHVNVCVGDQRSATAFYVTALGLTRDPFLMTGTGNMWVNVGKSQFHLPTGEPQVLRGVIGLVVPDLNALVMRLEQARYELAGTCFDFYVDQDGIATTCPWGNRITCHAPDHDRFGPVRLGMAYVRFDVPRGSAAGIARFYREILGTHADTIETPGGAAARVTVGDRQCFLFEECDEQRTYDGDHVQVYLADFSGPYQRLLKRGLITQESGQHQYRFVDIVDLDAGSVLTSIDHEVRSMSHPLYARPLVNRDPAVSIRTYRAGSHENLAWTIV